jgi:hypothetical protein
MITNKQSVALEQCKIQYKVLLIMLEVTLIIFLCIFRLEKYDSDKKIPVYGFGGRFNGALSHCYPLNGDFDDVCC